MNHTQCHTLLIESHTQPNLCLCKAPKCNGITPCQCPGPVNTSFCRPAAVQWAPVALLEALPKRFTSIQIKSNYIQ